MHFRSRSAKHATDGGTSRRFLDRFHTPRTSSKRRRAPMLEMLEGRTLLSISANSAAGSGSIGALVFTGSGSGNDQLTLSTTKVSGTVTGFDAIYNVSGTLTDHYYLNSDGVTTIAVTYPSGDINSTLILGDATKGQWAFNIPITLTGDSTNSTTLETQATSSSNTWTLSSTAYGGTITNESSTLVTFTNVSQLTAGSGATDTLVGESTVDSHWTLGGTNSGTYSNNLGPALTFTGFNTLQGSATSGGDVFDVNAAFSGSLKGGGSTSTAPDVFNLNPGGSVSGTITGMSGDSIINYYTAANVTISGFDGSSGHGYSGNSFSGINQINAELGGTLTGDSTASTWTLASTGSTYNDTSSDSAANPLIFSGFHALEGGSGSNNFDVQQNTSANLIGGTGTNDFVFTNNATLYGSIGGGTATGTHTLDLSNYDSSLSAVLTGSNTTGLAGTVDPVTGGFTGINVLKAGSGTNTLTGEGDTSTWNLDITGTDHNGQTYSDGHATLTFSGFGTLYGGAGINTFNVLNSITANLYGGAGANDFVFSSGASLNGSITGGADIDTLDLSAYGSSLTAVLNNTSATNGLAGTVAPVTGGFTGIDVLTGSGTGSLTGENTNRAASTTWNLNSTETYYDGTATLTFSGFGTLDGGSAANTFNILAAISASLNGGSSSSNSFVFHNGGSLNGTINGQTAANSTIDYSAYTSAVTVNLATGASTGTNGISHIGILVGGSNTTLVGPNNTAIFWTINASTPGTLATTSGGSAIFTFSSVKNLTGGVLPNTFVLATGASITGAITGGSTNDTLDLSGSSGPATVNVTNNNAGSVRIGNSTVLNFSRIANVKGTAGNDNFVLSNGKGLTGWLNGDGGSDTLSYAAYTTSVRVNLTTGVATGIYGGISNGIENVTGGSGNDILIGDTNVNHLTDGNGNDIIVGGGGADIINGGTGYDIIITGDASSAATVYGNGGTDLMIGGSYTQQTNLAALNSLMAEWDRTDVSLATKISHLKGTAGGRNGTYDLTSSTVSLDSAIAALYGGNLSGTVTDSGNNWFIADPAVITASKVHSSTGDSTASLS